MAKNNWRKQETIRKLNAPSHKKASTMKVKGTTAKGNPSLRKPK